MHCVNLFVHCICHTTQSTGYIEKFVISLNCSELYELLKENCWLERSNGLCTSCFLESPHIILIIILTEHWSEMRDFVGNFVHQPGIYRDIMDGKVYQKYRAVVKKNGFFPITLYWHLDGAPAMKFKNMSLWPIQSFVFELPLNLRYSYRNILLSGLWYGKKKPNMAVFQGQFVNQVKLLGDGFQFHDMCTTPIFKLCTNGQAAHLAAKGPSLNFKLCCGQWGCSMRLHPGRRLPGRGNRRIYMYTPNPFPKRKHADSIRHAH